MKEYFVFHEVRTLYEELGGWVKNGWLIPYVEGKH